MVSEFWDWKRGEIFTKNILKFVFNPKMVITLSPFYQSLTFTASLILMFQFDFWRHFLRSLWVTIFVSCLLKLEMLLAGCYLLFWLADIVAQAFFGFWLVLVHGWHTFLLHLVNDSHWMIPTEMLRIADFPNSYTTKIRESLKKNQIRLKKLAKMFFSEASKTNWQK